MKISRVHSLALILFFSYGLISCNEEEPSPSSQDEAISSDQIEITPNTDDSGPVDVYANETNGRVTHSTWTDRTGKIQFIMSMWDDGGNRKNLWRNIFLDVETGYVAVGGGVLPNEVNNIKAGALMTRSYPCPDLECWQVGTKDHIRPDPHGITVYAIGMKINGLTRSQLMNHITLRTRTSPSASWPSTTATVPGNYVLIGGGAYINWEGTGYVPDGSAGNLLTESYPLNPQTWVAKGKDHKIVDRAPITAYAIGIHRSIPGIGEVETQIFSKSTYASSGYRRVHLYMDSQNWALSCPGGRGTWSYGRLLTEIVPWVGGTQVSVANKDHLGADAGHVYAYAIGMRMRN